MSLLGLLRGKSAEKLAINYLRRQGLKIVAENVRYKCGEIDVIAKDDRQHIFVEVKYRQNEHYGTSAEMVSIAKQQKIARASKSWLQDNDPQFNLGCRFDVIAISGNAMGKPRNESIEWIKGAFCPELW